MPERTYPYKAWALLPSFKPVEVELTARLNESWDYGKKASGTALDGEPRLFHIDSLSLTKAAAIEVGRKRVATMQANLDKTQKNINNRSRALDKASEQETKP